MSKARKTRTRRHASGRVTPRSCGATRSSPWTASWPSAPEPWAASSPPAPRRRPHPPPVGPGRRPHCRAGRTPLRRRTRAAAGTRSRASRQRSAAPEGPTRTRPTSTRPLLGVKSGGHMGVVAAPLPSDADTEPGGFIEAVTRARQRARASRRLPTRIRATAFTLSSRPCPGARGPPWTRRSLADAATGRASAPTSSRSTARRPGAASPSGTTRASTAPVTTSSA